MNFEERFGFVGVLVAVIIGAFALVALVMFLALGSPSNWFREDHEIEIHRAGNTYTLIGHCEGGGCGELDVTLNNMMTRKAGRICAENGMNTERVAKIGDQRYVVVCV